MIKEIWKPVVGYEAMYEVSNLGRVKSLNYRRSGREGIMTPTESTCGYPQLILSRDSTQNRFVVHCLVYEAFNGKIPEGHVIEHINGVKNDNRIENLRIATREENNFSKQQQYMKPVSQYTQDGEFIKEWPNAKAVERELGFSQSNISKCCRGRYKQAYKYIWRFA